MAENLNKVDTELKVAGKKTHFVSLHLNQSFNSHHSFVIEVDYEELDENWMESPAKLIGLIGETVIITMKHKQTGEENLFEGIITNVTLSGYHGQQNAVIIEGKSSTIKLDGKETMDSFMDKTLKQIVDEAVANSGNGGSVTGNPVFQGKLDYICQYNESCFAFVNRLSWLFGEFFYSDGKKIYFGKPGGGNVTDIMYDKEMTRFDLSANLIPPTFNRYYYLQHDDKEIDQDASGSVDGVEGYLQKSLAMSDKLYTSEANLPLNPVITTKKEQEDMVKVEKTRAVSDMLTVTGSTLTCKIKIGEKIKIKFPESMQVSKKEVDTFIITELSHSIDQEGHYSNNFKGVMAGMQNIPMTPCPAPVATPQLAWVKENVDEKKRGRIKVQFQWQKKMNKTTNWIRVQTLDAGTSGAFPKNRGHVFIPEKDDQVMIGFEYGDPNRPYMTGSMFPERYAKGGEADNNIKSIKTRSGHMIEFNDEVTGGWGITIKDDCGNVIHLSTKGKNIDITAPETITLSAKNIQMNANENIKMSAGDDIIESAGKNKTDTAGETHITSAKNKKTFVDEDSYTQVKKNVTVDVLKNTTVNVDDDVKVRVGKLVINVVDEDTIIKSTGKITLKSGDIIDVAQG